MTIPARVWLARYDTAWLRADAMAGVTLAAYLLPGALGDASLAGLPPQAGLYACVFSGLVFWLFCSSRQTVISVTSAISLLVGASLGEIAGGDPARHAALAACTALLVAGLAFAAYAVRAGAVVSFFSETVLVGFKCGVALFLASTQLPKLFGFPGSHGDFWERMGHFFRGLGQTNPLSLALGIVALVLLLLGKTVWKHLPISLFVVVGGIVVGGGAAPGRARRGAARHRSAGLAAACVAARQPDRRQRGRAAGHGLLHARGGGNHGDRTDVRGQARLSARCDAGVPRHRQPRISWPVSAAGCR